MIGCLNGEERGMEYGVGGDAGEEAQVVDFMRRS